MTGLEVGGDFVHRPAAKAAALIVGDVRRNPALQDVASQSLPRLVAAEEILRRMTGSTMAEAFGQVGAAIPLRAFIRIGLECTRREEELIPNEHGRANVERKWQLIRLHRVMHGWHRVEIGADRQRIVARDFGVIIIRHGRVEMRAVPASSLRQRIDELFIGPGTDAGFRIGSDVGRDKLAERRLDRPSAGVIMTAALQRVACGAIADDGEVMSALDLAEVLGINAGRRSRGAAGQNQRQAEQTTAQRVCFITHAREDPDS